jgi:hypothetical protein
MDCLHVGPFRGPAAAGRRQGMTHFTLIPYGPRLSAVANAR